jgi:hypothetical protein
MVLDGLVERFFEALTRQNGPVELRGFSVEQVLDFQEVVTIKHQIILRRNQFVSVYRDKTGRFTRK